jgi:D-alanine-D-alanine ligase
MTKTRIQYPIGVTIFYYKGTGGDMDDTLENVRSISGALDELGYLSREVEVTKKNWRKAVRAPGEIFFNLCEDENYSLYSKMATHLEWLGRGQVGWDGNAARYGLHKAKMKRKLKDIGVATPSFRILKRNSKVPNIHGLEYPLMVKPSGQHAGIGISQDSVVIDQKELEERVRYLFTNYPGEVVVEEFVEGREIHVTVIGNGKHLAALPPCEIIFTGEFKDNWAVYTYDAKWEKSSWEYWGARVKSPPDISRKLDRQLEEMSKKAFLALGCKDIARFDIRVDEKNRPFIIDVNMSPSLNLYDDQDATIKSIQALGWSYKEFIEKLVAITYKRVHGKLPDRIRERHFLLAAPRS